MKVKILYWSIIGIVGLILAVTPLLFAIIVAVIYYYPKLKPYILREGLWVEVKGKSGKIIYVNSGWFLIECLDEMETVKKEDIKIQIFKNLWLYIKSFVSLPSLKKSHNENH